MRVGDVLADRFELERHAGSGGTSIVYRAVDLETDAWVAVKALRPLDPGDVERFAHEATLLAEIRHPAIVEYVAHGMADGGRPYLVMEWIEGESLEKRLGRGPLSIPDTIALGRTIAEALGAAHRRGVVHRDIKPGNIMLQEGLIEGAKLLDFGIARSSGGLGLTLTGALIGTPGYMSPEQARGEKEIDARADVFALGCLLFRCLTGRPVFGGNDLLAAILKVVVEDAPRLATIVPATPARLDALVARMLSRPPDGRPRDGAAVAAALAALEATAGGEPVSVTAPAPSQRSAPALTTTERRLVCLVLVRTGRPGSLAVPAPAVSAMIARHRGVFESLADGSLLGILSGDGAPTDQASRAARCALATRALVAEAQVALVTGRAVIGESRPVGEAIDRAVALIPLDDDGVPRRGPGRGVWIDEVTAGLVASRFDISGDEAGLFLRGERDLGAESRTLLGNTTPFVGRDRELAALLAAFDACVAGPSARAVLVTAGPGVGKSRLRHELVGRITGRGGAVEVLLGGGDAMSAGAPLGMIAAALRRAAGVIVDEPLAVRQRKLAARIGRHLHPRDRARVVEFLGELAFSPFPDQHSEMLRAARQNPTLKGDQMRLAWEDWLAAECRAQPVLIALEDLQWGDLPSVQFLDAALRNLADRPLLVLGLARPEVRGAFPGLWADRVVISMELENLTADASEILARHVLGKSVKPTAVARVVEQAAGNAFHLEELIRAVAEGRGDELPETVMAMLEARLADLGAKERRVLRAASIFGLTASESGVRALLGGALGAAEIKGALAELVQREVLTSLGQVRFAGEPEYAFRNTLVCEAAYAMLTDEDRTLGHRLAASFLERVGESEALAIAEHFERAGESRRAVSWYLRAAEQALEGCDDAAAIRRAKRGIACGVEGEEMGRMQLVLAQAHQSRGENAAAEAQAQEAMRRLPWGSARWYTAIAEAAAAASGQGHHERLIELAAVLRDAVLAGERSGPLWIAAARTVGHLYHIGRDDLGGGLLDLLQSSTYAGAGREPEVQGRLHSASAKRARHDGDPAGYLTERQAAAVALEEAGDVRGACLERVNVGFALIELGAYADAEQTLRAALATTDRLDLRAVRAAAQQNLGFALGQLGALDEALRLERQAVSQFAAQGNRRMEGGSRIYLSAILARRGELADAAREARAAAEILAAAPPLLPSALAAEAHVLLRAGHPGEARAAAEAAVELMEALGQNAEGEALIFLVHAETLDATGDRPAARKVITGARTRIFERAANIRDAGLRQSFLRSVPEHQRTLALAAAWLGSSA